MKVDIKKISGEDSGRKADLPKDIFGITPSDHAIYLAVTAERSNKRHGTHSTLERGEVSGSTKKPWRQKGTGGARAGSVKTPLWPGGGITFGPLPHLHKKALNVKLKRLARKSALTYKATNERIVVVEDFHTLCAEAPKTKKVFDVLGNLGLQKKVEPVSKTKKKSEPEGEKEKKSKRITKVLMLVDKAHAVKNKKDQQAYDNLRKSCRNVPGLRIMTVNDVSTYDIMNSDYLLFHETALKNVGGAFGAAKS